ncbi:MAG TPA: hypothetical protein VH396_02915 [Chitinophagaceae bacterium]|jgi:hypothetical protein
MVKRFSFVVALHILCLLCLHAQTNNSSTAFSKSKQHVTICNLVYGGNVQAISEDAPIVLYIDDSISHQKIQLIFSKKVRKKFSYDPEKKLPDHQACVSGRVTNQNGEPAIIITNEKQIETKD